jgi:two-component system LytT family response regulator
MENMLKTIIVDDEHGNRQVLRSLLETHCKEVHVVAEADSVDSAYQAILNAKPNLIFLDIQMPTGNGFQLLEKFEEVSFDTIFVTSYDQYAINAIKFSALDYLLKPVDIAELKGAVEKAVKKAGEELRQQEFYQNLLNNIQPGVNDKKMVVHVNTKAILIQMSQVAYVEADSNYSFIHMMSGETYHTSKTLKEIEEFTVGLNRFIRINRSVIINVSYCAHYHRGEPFSVILKNDLCFEISRRKRPEVLEKLKSFIP